MEEKDKPIAIISKQELLQEIIAPRVIDSCLREDKEKVTLVIASIVSYCRYYRGLGIDDIIAALKALKIEVVEEVNKQ